MSRHNSIRRSWSRRRCQRPTITNAAGHQQRGDADIRNCPEAGRSMRMTSVRGTANQDSNFEPYRNRGGARRRVSFTSFADYAFPFQFVEGLVRSFSAFLSIDSSSYHCRVWFSLFCCFHLLWSVRSFWRQAAEGTAIGEVCRKAEIIELTYHNWAQELRRPRGSRDKSAAPA